MGLPEQPYFVPERKPKPFGLAARGSVWRLGNEKSSLRMGSGKPGGPGPCNRTGLLWAPLT